MHIGLIYFGVVRSIHLTMNSIQEKIIQPLQNAGASMTSIASLNIMPSINAPRAGEANIPLNPANCFKLGADYYMLASQNDEDISEPWHAARTKDDPFADDYRSIGSHLHQLASLKRGWSALETTAPQGCDVYLFLRPDLIYWDSLNLTELLPSLHDPHSILIPEWHSWGGLNDRMALARPEAARHYALRFENAVEFCRIHPLHSETMLAWTLARHGCKIGRLPLRASRVRANGDIFAEDWTHAHLPLP